jgi:hypothetical protein
MSLLLTRRLVASVLILSPNRRSDSLPSGSVTNTTIKILELILSLSSSECLNDLKIVEYPTDGDQRSQLPSDSLLDTRSV